MPYTFFTDENDAYVTEKYECDECGRISEHKAMWGRPEGWFCILGDEHRADFVCSEQCGEALFKNKMKGRDLSG